MLMSVKNLSVSYYLEKREVKAVRDASFDVEICAYRRDVCKEKFPEARKIEGKKY